MAKWSNSGFQTQIDASYGLIYRMNYLWSEVDRQVLKGDLDMWNFILDRIYCNLLYKNPMEILEDEKGNIIEISLSEKDGNIFNKLSNNIRECKKKKMEAIKKRKRMEYNNACADLYDALMKKDIWLRKFMMELRLYLKETSSNPATALFGQ